MRIIIARWDESFEAGVSVHGHTVRTSISVDAPISSSLFKIGGVRAEDIWALATKRALASQLEAHARVRSFSTDSRAKYMGSCDDCLLRCSPQIHYAMMDREIASSSIREQRSRAGASLR